MTEYLDVQNVVDGAYQTSVSLNEQNNDINAFFAKKKPQRQKNGLLFKFDSSTHTMSFNTYLKDHRYSSLNLMVILNFPFQIAKFRYFFSFILFNECELSTLQDNKDAKPLTKLVCKSDPKNITLIFRPITQFIDEVENVLGIDAR